MKTFTLIAAAALAGLSATAQEAASNLPIIDSKPSHVHYITLADAAVKAFEENGAKVNYVGPAEELGHYFYWWNQAGWAEGDTSYPRFDMEEGGYIALTVTGEGGWSGGGFFIAYEEGDEVKTGADLSNFNDDTRFHMGYMTSGSAPAGVCFVVMDGSDHGSTPAKFAIGDTFDGANAIGAKFTDEWQAIDMSLGELKKFCPEFNPAGLDRWYGNILSISSGAVAGSTFSLDAVYFYQPAGTADEDGIREVNADKSAGRSFMVSGDAIHVNGGMGISLYDAAGRLVKASNGAAVATSGLAKGIYVAKSGNQTQKVFVK